MAANISFQNAKTLKASFESSKPFNAFLYKEVLHDKTVEVVEEYKGEYIVEPSSTEQKLKTADKKMIKDVTIKPVRTYEVSNEAGGTTFSIL